MLDIKEATEGLTDEEIRNYVNQTTVKFFTGRTAMANYTGKQSVQDEALGEFADYGFTLAEPDDHILELWFKDKRIACFNQTAVTFDDIRKGCRNFLVNTGDMTFIARRLEADFQATYGEELKKGG